MSWEACRGEKFVLGEGISASKWELPVAVLQQENSGITESPEWEGTTRTFDPAPGTCCAGSVAQKLQELQRRALGSSPLSPSMHPWERSPNAPGAPEENQSGSHCPQSPSPRSHGCFAALRPAEEAPQLMRTRSDVGVRHRGSARTPGEQRRLRRHRFSINGHFYNHKVSPALPGMRGDPGRAQMVSVSRRPRCSRPPTAPSPTCASTAP